ncbi:hypothetical protein V9T40_014168 [Parthenolecanium corni]|uniref:MD-2-related lipid-recognition domain-containing protein n=1 Tax=Parthenolecanium corni TaxID=536013 RepID=A0AAN9TEP1_9HEMI
MLIHFRVTENFTSQIYSTVLLVDIPDVDHSRPGCQYTKCPIVAGEKYTFQSTRYVKPIYPAVSYKAI